MSRLKLIAIAVTYIIIFSIIAIVPTDEGLAEPADFVERQPILLHLGGGEGEKTLKTSLDGIGGESTNSDRDTAIGLSESLIDVWSTVPLENEITIEGDIPYVFFVTGDVDGVRLIIEVDIAGNVFSETTLRQNVGEDTIEYAGEIPISGIVGVPSGESLSISISWEGSEWPDGSGEYALNDSSVSILYGLSYQDSFVQINANSISAEKLVIDSPDQNKQSLTIRINAISAFGPQDIVDGNISSTFGGATETVTNYIDGNKRVFILEWNYSGIDFPEGSYVVSIELTDINNNIWRSEQTAYIIMGVPEIDVALQRNMVSIEPGNPKNGEHALVGVRVIGHGKNWENIAVRIKVYDGNDLIGEKTIEAIVGENPAVFFDWIPKFAGRHQIKVVLDESTYENPHKELDNNQVIITRTVTDVEALTTSSNAPAPNFIWYAAVIAMVFLVVAALFSVLLRKSKPKQRKVLIDESEPVMSAPINTIGQPMMPPQNMAPSPVPQSSGYQIKVASSPRRP